MKFRYETTVVVDDDNNGDDDDDDDDDECEASFSEWASNFPMSNPYRLLVPLYPEEGSSRARSVIPRSCLGEHRATDLPRYLIPARLFAHDYRLRMHAILS